jgi:hypothetical protein
MLTIIRLLELCEGLGESAPELLARALQKVKLHLDNLTMRVDLRKVLNDHNDTFRPLKQWARNRIRDSTDGVVDLTPSGTRELAASIGFVQDDLSRYLSQFIPEPKPEHAAA